MCVWKHTVVDFQFYIIYFIRGEDAAPEPEAQEEIVEEQPPTAADQAAGYQAQVLRCFYSEGTGGGGA